MYTCDDYREWIWDDLYGLLATDGSELLERHLQSCAACQAVRTRAVSAQKRIARAARLNVVVLPFSAPDTEPITLPLSTRPLRPFFPRWSWLAAAAALLLVVGLSYRTYQTGLDRREAAFAEAKDKVALVAHEREALQKRFRDAVVQVALESLHVEAFGPDRYQPGGVNRYYVFVTDRDGTPAEVRIAVRLVDAAGKLLHEMPEQTGRGEVSLLLPPDWNVPAGTDARLEILVRGTHGEEKLTHALRGTKPEYASQLVTEKASYRPGEKVAFRLLTLERFTLRPPGQPFTVRFTLKGSGGPVQEVRGQTGDGGMALGQMTLPPTLASGTYTLEAVDLENRFRSVSAPVAVADRAPTGQPSEPAVASEQRSHGFVLPPAWTAVQGMNVAVRPSREGEPIKLTLRQQAPIPELLVAAFCRGQLIGLKRIHCRTGSTSAEIRPDIECAGLVSVAVFAPQPGAMQPLAKGFGRRDAARPLVLSAEPNRPLPAPGTRVTLKLRSAEANGTPVPAWLMVSIWDKAFSSGAGHLPEQSLPARFYTDGADETVALVHWTNTFEGKPRGDESLAALTKSFESQDQQLVLDGKERLRAAQDLGQDVDAYRERGAWIVTLAIRAGVAAGLAGGSVLLALALFQLARGFSVRRAFLAGGFSALAVAAFGAFGPLGGPAGPQVLPSLGPLAGIIDRVWDPGLPANGPSQRTIPDLPWQHQRPRMMPLRPTGPDEPRRPEGKSSNRPQESAAPPAGKLAWFPVVPAPDGTAEVTFEVPANAGNLHIRVEGYTTTGRLGSTDLTTGR
jgi:hypothetical protein